MAFQMEEFQRMHIFDLLFRLSLNRESVQVKAHDQPVTFNLLVTTGMESV